MITWAEVRTVLRRVLRWWWIIVLAVAVSSGTGYYLSGEETRFYVAHTSLMIGNTLESKIPDQNQLAIGWSLARYYGELSRREPILKPVQEALGLPFAWEIISDRMLTTNVVPSANLLEIYITDSNPERAAVIANAIGDQLIKFSPNAPDKIQAEKEAVDQQIQQSQKKSQEIQDKIGELTNQQQSATSASDLAEINQKLALLQSNLDQEQASYKSLLNYKNSSIVNSLDFFERAVPPNQPLPSKRKVIVGFAGLAGLMLALAAIFVIERVDERWRGPRDIEDHFDIDDLGTIPIGPPLLTAPEMFAEERLQAARDVQTNILLAAAEQGARILMITSPQPSESRTSFVIDLADLFGRSGHRVLIVDADFTTSLLTRMLAQTAAAHTWTVMTSNEHNDLWVHLRPTPLTNVALLPGRGYSAGAPAMIPSLRWRELVERLLTTADVIIFDGPATLSGPDAALLAPHVDGVVLTLDPATDNREDIAKSKTRLLRQKGARLLGAVTFAPSKQRPRLGGVFRQLRGQPMPALAAPEHPADQNVREIPMLAQQHAPIVTPPPETVMPVVSALEPELTTPEAADLEEHTVTTSPPTIAQQAAADNRPATSAGHEQFSAEAHRRARRGRRPAREAPGAGATNDEAQKA